MVNKLLLHVCCAPCMSQSLRVVSGLDEKEGVLLVENAAAVHFKPTAFYYNPNIQPEKEYEKRYLETARLAGLMGNTPVIRGRYDAKDWLKSAVPLKDEPERGKRCLYCYEMRLRETFITARDTGFGWVATTLTLSPHKNAAVINAIGLQLESEYSVRYLPTDFKKKDGYRKSIELSRKHKLYRQNYCGCVFSVRDKQNIDK